MTDSPAPPLSSLERHPDAESREGRRGSWPPAIVGTRLVTAVDRLAAATVAAQRSAPSELASSVESAVEWLTYQVIPWLRVEEEVLYPALKAALAEAPSTAPLEAEHLELRSLTERLALLADHLRSSLHRSDRKVLQHTLERAGGLLRSHLDQESELYGRVLQGKAHADEERQLLEAMRKAERRAKENVLLVGLARVGSTEAVALRHNPRARRAFVVSLADLEGGSEGGA
jgi:Hemerythrin HHE cation binding domain